MTTTRAAVPILPRGISRLKLGGQWVTVVSSADLPLEPRCAHRRGAGCPICALPLGSLTSRRILA